uniref:Protein kinase domain-containing protein n=1 Tax=Fagus sylvatica TaxID=28930 RepID=A0A2N9EE01_FAGSY
MTNLSMLTPIVSVLCLFVLLYPITAASSTNFSYIPVDDIKLSCGSNGNSKGLDGRVWTGDDNSSFFPREEDNLKSNISEPPKEVLVQGAPYTTTRISYSRFTYVFSVTPGPKFVRLFFYPASYSGFEQSTDFFTVTAGSFTLLKNFSASILLDSLQGTSVLVKEFCANVDGDQKLNLAFIPLTTSYGNCYAFINGIEIVSMPEYLYYSKGLGPSDKEVPLSVGSSHQFYMYYTTALEMVFRLNVGGGLISPMDDTDMFRKWSPDGNYFKLAGVVQHRPSLIPKFSKIPNYTAPGDVYRSARSMSLNQSKNLLSNLTWELPVDSGFFYLVRLHFCEIDININNVSESQFIIYIDYQLAEENADVISITGGAGIPVYRDYVVWIKNEEVERTPDYSLFISLHPKGGNSTFYDAILNGIEVFKLSNSDGNLGKSSDPKLGVMVNTAIESKKNKTFIAIGISTGLFALLFLMGCIVFQNQRKAKRSGSNYQLSRYWCWLRLNSYKGKQTGQKTFSLRKEQCNHFSLAEIKIATNNFHKDLIIGVGGFGNVYKGEIDDEETMTVAIKRLDPQSRQGAHEFRTEIEMLSQLRYVHLVSLIGYCNDEGEMILVYDYMNNGTLREHLYDTNNDPLPWKKRLDICIGAARGLDYLHRGVKHTIIHRDVKTTNILLDEKWIAKVSDFGLSKMDQNNTTVSTMLKGTWGYLDPEYARRQKLSEKSDVYAFGVVLLEVLCARKALNHKLEEEQWNLAHWARKCIDRGTINEIIDPNLKGKIAPKCFEVFMQIAESCTRDEGIQRPTMGDVVEKLKFALEMQENAEAENESMNPGSEYIYPSTLSFFIDTTDDGPWATNEHGMTSDSGIVTRLTYSSFDEDCITSHNSQEVLKNSTKA